MKNKKDRFQATDEIENNKMDKELYRQFIENTEGDISEAKRIYLHRRSAELEFRKSEDLDKKEKWPMLIPLLVLYSLGTIGVLLLVFVFLSQRLGW